MTEKDEIRGLILIPAYDEERSVASVACHALAYLPVLVVDDGSKDDTVKQARMAGAEVISQGRNMGKGAALQTGFTYALDNGYGYVITLDADGQHDPHEIPGFIKAFTGSQADLVVGRRDFSRMPLVRRISNTFGTLVFSWAAERPIPDNQSGYRLVSRRMMEEMCQPGERGFEFEVEMIMRCIMRGWRMEWVRIRTIYRDEKSHIQPFRHAAGFIRVSLRARRLLRGSRLQVL